MKPIGMVDLTMMVVAGLTLCAFAATARTLDVSKLFVATS